MIRYLKAIKYSFVVEGGYGAVFVLLAVVTLAIGPDLIPPEITRTMVQMLLCFSPLVLLASLVLLIIGCHTNDLSFLKTTLVIYVFLLTHVYVGVLMMCWDEGPVFYGLAHLSDLFFFSIPCIVVALIIASLYKVVSLIRERGRM